MNRQRLTESSNDDGDNPSTVEDMSSARSINKSDRAMEAEFKRQTLLKRMSRNVKTVDERQNDNKE